MVEPHISHRLRNLKNKIGKLNTKIREEMKRPRPSYTKLKYLKKLRLQYKDRMQLIFARDNIGLNPA